MEGKGSLIHIVPTNRWGGVQSYAFDICRHYREAGWDVTAVTRNAVSVDAPFVEAGIRLLHAPVIGFHDGATVMTIARFLRHIPPGGPVVIHTHRYRDAFTAVIAKMLAKRKDVRVVSTRHTVRRGRDSWIFRRLYRMVDAHIFVSQMAYDGFMGHNEKKLGLDPKKVHILHNSLNLPETIPTAEPAHGPVTALYQGAIARGKGLETLIDAMSMLKKDRIRLRISGNGNPDYLDILRRHAMMRDVMDAIDWNLKAKPSVEICEEAHFGVVPSTEREAFSLASLRLMASMRAQVCTSHGAQTEYLAEGHTAFLVEPGKAKELADAMRRLANDRELRLAMGYAAYKDFTANLSWKTFINKLNNIYTK